MKRVIRLTENDLARIVKRVISEQPTLGDLGKLPTPTMPTIGSSLIIFKTKKSDENFFGTVCRIDGKYLYLKSSSSGKCAEYLWDPRGLTVTKSGNAYEIKDPTYNIMLQDCVRACKK